MASNHTTNYDLNQWEGTDKVLRTEFNEDNAKIDAALKANADGIDTLEGQVSAVQAAMGNCTMETVIYTGTGTYGGSSPTQINFTRPPQLVVIIGRNGSAAFCGRQLNRYTVMHSGTITYGGAGWSGNRLTLAHDSYQTYQMNNSGTVYQAFGFSLPE